MRKMGSRRRLPNDITFVSDPNKPNEPRLLIPLDPFASGTRRDEDRLHLSRHGAATEAHDARLGPREGKPASFQF